MTSIGQLAALRPGTRSIPLPERVVITFRDDPAPATPLPIPQQQTAAAGVICGGFFLIFAAIALQTVGSMDFGGVRSVFDLVFLLFQGFWVLGWSLGVLILFLLTLFLLFFRESVRVSANRLVHVWRLGIVRFVSEYDLRRIENLRLEGPERSDLVRIRFTYGEGEHGIGQGMARETAQVTIRILEGAISRRQTPDSDAATAVDDVPLDGATLPEAGTVRGIDLTGWLVRIANRARVRSERPTDVAPGGYSQRPDVAPRDALASATLVVANMMPLAGVMLLDWKLSDIMVLFWAENAIIGGYNIARLIKVSGWSSVFVVPFFAAHYGGFMVGHFLFVYYLFVRGVGASGEEASAMVALAQVFVPLWPALLLLTLSHGVEYVTGFLGRREYVGRTVSQQMREPYKRIILLHVTIIFGGWLTLALGAPVFALALLCVLKTFLDLRLATQVSDTRV